MTNEELFCSLPIYEYITSKTFIPDDQRCLLLDRVYDMFINSRGMCNWKASNLDNLFTWSHSPFGSRYWSEMHSLCNRRTNI